MHRKIPIDLIMYIDEFCTQKKIEHKKQEEEWNSMENIEFDAREKKGL